MTPAPTSDHGERPGRLPTEPATTLEKTRPREGGKRGRHRRRKSDRQAAQNRAERSLPRPSVPVPCRAELPRWGGAGGMVVAGQDTDATSRGISGVVPKGLRGGSPDARTGFCRTGHGDAVAERQEQADVLRAPAGDRDTRPVRSRSVR